MAKNFTEFGFGLARAPDDLMEALRQGIRDGLEKGPRLEQSVEVIEGLQPWFIDRPGMHLVDVLVLLDLLPISYDHFPLFSRFDEPCVERNSGKSLVETDASSLLVCFIFEAICS